MTAEQGRLEEAREQEFSDASHPLIGLLSNGRYSVMITSNGSGWSAWGDMDVTRWREDGTRDCWGQFCYIRDRSNGKRWSTGKQPLCQPADECDVEFHVDRAEFSRRDGDIETKWAVCVAPDYDAEVRLVTLINHSSLPCELDLTSYAEVCLNQRRADQAHPAFAKLFLETEFVASSGALLARRRPRAADQKPIWAVHVTAVEGLDNDALEYETDRVRFLGRGRTPANPAALEADVRLSGTTGPVLDPVFSLRRHVRLDPKSRARVAFVTGAADTLETAAALIKQFQNLKSADQAFSDAGKRSYDEVRDLGLTPSDVALFNRLAGTVVFSGSVLRSAEAVAANRLGQPALWPHGISGDRPIVLVRIAVADDEALVQQLVQWHGYVRHCGLDLDLVILDARSGAAADSLKAMLEAGPAGATLGKPGGTFVLSAGRVPAEDIVLITAAARTVLGADRGSLAEQIEHRPGAAALPPLLKATASSTPTETATARATPPEELQFWNGFGGFTPDGREYVIIVDDTAPGGAVFPPAPWTNVLANPGFGCLVTEAGLGYSWAGNSQMNRLTPWSNDPVSDPPGEAVYLRDEETGTVWSPTPLPLGDGAVVTVRHGQAYSRFTRSSHGLDQELLAFVPLSDPVKLLCLTLRNVGERPRRLSATYYAEWVLGTVQDNAPLQVVCEYDLEAGAVLARNAWAGAFASGIAFAGVGSRQHTFTANRTEFLGRNGSTASPAALRRVKLSGSVEPLLDPCAAVMTDITLAPGQTAEVVFVIGQAESTEQARHLIQKYTAPGTTQEALSEVQRHWDHVLGTVQVKTPDAELDLMMNRWLLYQVLACRVWGRSAFYQSGGAYGFRDQLQDVMALVISAPNEARIHIMRAAARQFEEGDVQHWWHPPVNAGVRTRITDDLYFLPLAVHHYVTATGDLTLLDEQVPFLKSPLLRPDQEDDYSVPSVSMEEGSIYDHCVRALEHGFQLGSHGLPLMGTGDWNDGMNKVGALGQGESVWNGWFFVTVLNAFAEVADRRADEAQAAWCRERAEALRTAIEANAWDGEWYRRAYFDDGTPLGSAQNDECQIDAIPQAWAVISGRADPVRAQLALAAVEKRLVRTDGKLIQLLDPAFDKGELQPGYIKGYVPGIRENGGQYTHAATWVVLAMALQGHGDRALELWNLLNPVRHTKTPAEVEHYKVEPYVVCADIYAAPPHTGRGGWTWYTGSAGWLYRVALEAILGIHPVGNTLRIDPCVPRGWPGFEVTYRHETASYRIRVANPAGVERGVRSVTVDGQPVSGGTVLLLNDSSEHDVRVELG